MTAEQAKEEAALDDLRVLDLADEKGVYCGKVFAGLGAEVIKIERPGGDPMRDNGPFYRDIPHRERSLYWWHFNTNKKSITLNLETADGQEIFKRLVKTADILVETYNPGYLDGLGLGYEELSRINPGLIMTSITHFGQKGPYKHFKGSDIVDLALGGFMSPCGHPDTPPVMPYAEQGYHTASSYGAIASLIALYNRDVREKGQHIDIPIQTCAAFSLEFANLWYIYWGQVLPRRGARHGSQLPGSNLGNLVKAKDGHVCVFPGILPLDWMEADGMVADLKEPEWALKIYARTTPEEEQHVVEVRDNWAQNYTKAELFEGCQNMHIPWSSVNTFAEMCNDRHLWEHGFFVEIEHPELEETLTDSGAPCVMQATPWNKVKRAPLIGEQNLEIYQGELGFSKEQLVLLAEGGII